MIAASCEPADPERLAEANLWRCRVIALRMTRRRRRDFEEAHSVALVGLAEAVGVYCAEGDGPRAMGFAPFVNKRIAGRILDFFKAERPKGQTRRLGHLPLLTGEMPVHLSALPDGVPPADAGYLPVGWELEWEDFVIALSRRLPRQHGAFLRWRYLHADAATDRGVGVRMGFNQPRATVLHHEAIERLREHFGVDDASRAAGDIVHAILNDLSRKASAC